MKRRIFWLLTALLTAAPAVHAAPPSTLAKMMAMCQNPAGNWIPVLSAGTGTPYGYPNPIQLFFQDSSGTWRAAQCDSSGNLIVSGNSGLSGLTAGEAVIAATLTTATSSKALAGTGAGLVTGPKTSVLHDCPWYTDTAGTQGDSAGTGCSIVTATQYQFHAGLISAGSTIIANTTRVYDFVPPVNLSVTKLSYRIGTADNTTNLYSLGIYSNTGTLLCTTGAIQGTVAFPVANNITNLSFTGTCNLTGGTRYLFAMTGQASTANMLGINDFGPQPYLAPSAGGATSGGVLNSSITPAADSFGVTVYPDFMLHN